MKTLLLLGFGASNQSVYNYLSNHHKQDVLMMVVDDNLDQEKQDQLTSEGIGCFSGSQFLASDVTPDCIIKSPGINFEHPILRKFEDIPTINDIELTYQIINGSNTKIIGITGTNGKTSTSMLLNNALQKAGYNSFVCGNVGILPLDIIDNNDNIDFLVMELSSFQLASIKDFACNIAIILNISPDHLDYHHTFGDYVNAKMNILKNLDNMELIVSGTSHLPTNFPVVYIKEGMDNYNNSISPLNVAIIRSVLEYLNIDQKVLTTMLENKEFILEHRNEYVDNIDGVTYINDSKATNVGATINALEQYENVYLIVGGSNKDEDMHPLGGFLDNVKQVVAYGENKLDFEFIPGIIIVNTLKEAIKVCHKLASVGDIVLLSPASASLDQFKNYQHRGDKFKQIVKELKED